MNPKIFDVDMNYVAPLEGPEAVVELVRDIQADAKVVTGALGEPEQRISLECLDVTELEVLGPVTSSLREFGSVTETSGRMLVPSRVPEGGGAFPGTSPSMREFVSLDASGNELEFSFNPLKRPFGLPRGYGFYGGSSTTRSKKSVGQVRTSCSFTVSALGEGRINLLVPNYTLSILGLSQSAPQKRRC